MKPAPFATTPEAVAEATVKALRRGPAHRLGAAGTLRPLSSIVRHLPGAVWRRLSL